jgi:ADP-ribose pyrophosphatase YjhB (NUDIX family)
MSSHKLLEYIKRVQSIAQAGITYAENEYDLERYEELRKISLNMLREICDEPLEKLIDLFGSETGYQTPKVDIRAVIVNDNKILMVREKVDNFWSLPGGWADVGYSPGEVAVKEVKEEAGLEVVPERILAVLDKKNHPHPPSPFHTYKIFIECSIAGGTIQNGMETNEVAFFSISEIPTLSEERITTSQIKMLFELFHDKNKAPVFD